MAKKWTTIDGKRIPIPELSDSHLLNIIRMLRRQAPHVKEVALEEGYNFLSTLRGEMATYYAEQDIQSVEDSTDEEFLSEYHPLWDDLVAEANRRGLNDQLG